MSDRRAKMTSVELKEFRKNETQRLEGVNPEIKNKLTYLQLPDSYWVVYDVRLQRNLPLDENQSYEALIDSEWKKCELFRHSSHRPHLRIEGSPLLDNTEVRIIVE